MSYLGGIGGGRGPVPPAPNAQNRDLQEPPTSSSIIKSAKWGRNQTLPKSGPVPMQVLLNRSPINPTAVIEVYFHQQGTQPVKVGNPISTRVMGLTLISQWGVTLPTGRDPFSGYFTFRVKIDNQTVRSDELRVTNDPVVRAVHRNNTDGWDG